MFCDPGISDLAVSAVTRVALQRDVLTRGGKGDTKGIFLPANFVLEKYLEKLKE